MSNDFTRKHVNMFGGNVKSVSFPVAGAATEVFGNFRCPYALTIVRAAFNPDSTGSTPVGPIDLIKGASTSVGTVASGATTAKTPVALTLVDAQVNCAAGDHLQALWTRTSGTLSKGTFQIDYVLQDA